MSRFPSRASYLFTLAAPAVSRRRFLGAAAAGASAGWAAGVVRRATAQAPQGPPPSQVTGTPIVAPETPGATMEGDGYRPVRLPPKPNARPSMSADDRNALEHRISCPCPCTLDVFTCRTSMPCGFSPRMHSDVTALVDGGHSADEILAAFEQVYGEQILMAPKREGFNWAGYLAPFAAIAAGGVAVAALLRRSGARAASVRAAEARAVARAPDATPDELARLETAVRGDAP